MALIQVMSMKMPTLSFTGSSEIVKSNHPTNNSERFYMLLKTSGTLTSDINAIIDAYLLGGGAKGGDGGNTGGGRGGGGGGGSGRIVNQYGHPISSNTNYIITIGQSDQDTTFTGLPTAKAGDPGKLAAGTMDGGNGGDGESGGGGGGATSMSVGGTTGGKGGTDGNSGTAGNAGSGTAPGKGGPGGLGTILTTKPFGGLIAPFNTMSLAKGGDGGKGQVSGASYVTPASKAANTGDGGDGANGGTYTDPFVSGGIAGSGIVIIRWGDWSA